ncbi:OLC1v1021866C1 [Oldenlandia corymbosa var. corymbosa]|uniref:OLC1v1021866C1 n=1 Tax=Oldenlandia corymbosa var. corymbosa TaxID=529605 RepID=A0AAV1BWL7_OLDCO|nr:OLC1v1021866C1 [Oldenlandia corymbosa var. corymbosa]
MPAVWFALKKSLHCKTETADVHDPNARAKHLARILTKKSSRSGCSRSIANLRDVIHGSKRHMEKPSICSPRSIGSSELLNPITHEVVLSNSTCELKITGNGFSDGNCTDIGSEMGSSTYLGTLKPGTPGPGGHQMVPYYKAKGLASPLRKSSGNISRRRNSAFGGLGLKPASRYSYGADFHGLTPLICHKCGDQFVKLDAAEEHHLSKHAVTELIEGDSSRKIVEIICRTSWTKSDNNSTSGGIERILKVHNMQKTIAQFEDYREVVKIKANKLPKKHPRCMADGNELLRFHGTTVECALGTSGSSLCTSKNCTVCRILRHGFSTIRELNKDSVGVFTASTSSRAFESIQVPSIGNPSLKKALIVCRVIAGRVHRPLENVQELVGQSGFDSLAGKVGVYSNIEELFLLNAKALLPCFVVICKS